MANYRLLIVVLTTMCGGCATQPSATDWATLASEATPTFRQGPCGTEVVWSKSIGLYETAEVEGVVIVRPKCDEAKP